MAAREAILTGIEAAPEVEDGTESLRLAQNSLLSEAPGVVVGFITLFYLVSSLVALI